MKYSRSEVETLVEHGGRLMPILGLCPDPDSNLDPGFVCPELRIANKLPSFQSMAAAETELRTAMMKEPCL